MKKTFKKQIILLAVIAVMMIFALVMPASAEEEVQIPCPGIPGGGHLEHYLDDIVIEPSCTQRGYSKQICTYCNDEVVVKAYKFTEPTGHNYKAEYVDMGDHYERVRTCQNEVCQRGGVDVTDQNKPKYEIIYPNGKDYAKDDDGNIIKYYRAEFVNTWQRKDGKTINNAEEKAFLDYCFDPSNSDSWVSNYSEALSADEKAAAKKAAYTDKLYTTGKKATVDNLAAAPAYEYAAEAEGLTLYISEGTEVPEYPKDTPSRNKDLDYGKYTFDGWVERAETENGKRVFDAVFTPVKDYAVTVSFYNYDGEKLSADIAVPYKGEFSYPDLKNPAKSSDQYSNYTFAGWAFGKKSTAPLVADTLKGSIKAYFNTSVYARFTGEPRTYSLEFAVYDKVIDDAKIEVVKSVDGVKCGDEIRSFIADIDTDRLEITRDKKYIYEQNDKVWAIKKVNGHTVLSDVTVKLDSLDLPSKLVIKNKDTGTREEYSFSKNETNTLTLVPVYDQYLVNYTFKVTVRPDRFLDEDVYSDNSMKTDILDKFIIQVTDENGQYIAAGTTDKNGEFWFETSYRDTLKITASMSNRKYAGEFDLNLYACGTKEEVDNIVKNGIYIFPQVTEEWTEGVKSCGCICHSFLSGIVVRIYNLLYRLFGIKYVCCDDLFVVHGEVLIYSR
ncbi:MAG: hypothetical protein E7543_03260 [Ruminococcaceae bacterium]|nr:hypothetical protein [Oscillospiraceae bacterium]